MWILENDTLIWTLDPDQNKCKLLPNQESSQGGDMSQGGDGVLTKCPWLQPDRVPRPRRTHCDCPAGVVSAAPLFGGLARRMSHSPLIGRLIGYFTPAMVATVPQSIGYRDGSSVAPSETSRRPSRVPVSAAERPGSRLCPRCPHRPRTVALSLTSPQGKSHLGGATSWRWVT